MPDYLETSFANVTRYRQYYNMKAMGDVYREENTYAYGQWDDEIGRIVYDGINFADIDDWNKIRIVGYKVKGRGGAMFTTDAERTKKSYLSFWLVTNYSSIREQRSGIQVSPVDGAADTHLLWGTKAGDTPVSSTNEWHEYEITDETDAGVQWMNANKSKVQQGGQFGIFLSGRYFRLYELGMVLYYVPESKLFVGSNIASAVYVGTAKASAVYIGDKKIV